MPLRRKHRQLTPAMIPTDSLSDVAFLLIIFFILTTSTQKFAGFSTDFPTAQRGQAQGDKTPTINLSAQDLRFNDKPMTLPQLKQELQALKLATQTDEGKVVLLEASGQVPYELYYQVMADISAAGGVVGIVREEEGSTGGSAGGSPGGSAGGSPGEIPGGVP